MAHLEFSSKVYAVIIREDEIVATLHDQGTGAYWGLPGEYVQPGDSIRATVELAVLEQTNLAVNVGRLLEVEYSVFPDNPYARIDMAFECEPQTGDEPFFPEDSEPSDESITGCFWVKVDDFMQDMPFVARDFWNRAIETAKNVRLADLHELDLRE